MSVLLALPSWFYPPSPSVTLKVLLQNPCPAIGWTANLFNQSKSSGGRDPRHLEAWLLGAKYKALEFIPNRPPLIQSDTSGKSVIYSMFALIIHGLISTSFQWITLPLFITCLTWSVGSSPKLGFWGVNCFISASFCYLFIMQAWCCHIPLNYEG